VILVVVEAPDPAGAAQLCRRVRAVLGRGDADAVTLDLGRVDRLDLATVAALARLQLTARRLGGRVRVRAADAALRGLLTLAGLDDVVPRCGGLPVQPRR
jgi:ABC-type transporter Mla MlaB component